jgi:hypothetical protein
MRKLIGVLAVVCLLLVGCQHSRSNDDCGSFTSEKIYSYDKKYYAEQKTIETDDIRFVEILIYTNEDKQVYSFVPARASDFWGICWENDNYNIWIQSADIGVICYSFDNETWTKNNAATRPNYIVSKYD